MNALFDRLYVAAANLRQAQRDYMEVRNEPRDIREPFGRAVADAADKLDDALALAAATGTAKTVQQAECGASQSGAAKTAQRPTSSTQSGVR